jgi:hypothetical protein
VINQGLIERYIVSEIDTYENTRAAGTGGGAMEGGDASAAYAKT